MDQVITTPTRFTQEIKDNWLKNLKSGKYKQGFFQLVEEINGEEFHCCIGVLGDCTPGLNNDDDSPYAFLNRTLGENISSTLWRKNDNQEYKKTGLRDYSNVIPLIEALPVQDAK